MGFWITYIHSNLYSLKEYDINIKIKKMFDKDILISNDVYVYFNSNNEPLFYLTKNINGSIKYNNGSFSKIPIEYLEIIIYKVRELDTKHKYIDYLYEKRIESIKINTLLKQDIFNSSDLLYLYSKYYECQSIRDFINKRDINKDYNRMITFNNKVEFANRVISIVRSSNELKNKLKVDDINVLKECMDTYKEEVLKIASKKSLDNEDFIRYIALNSQNIIALFENLPEKYFSNIRVMSNAMYNNLNFFTFIGYLNYMDALSVRKYTRFLKLLNNKDNQKVLLNNFWYSYIKNNDTETLDKYFDEHKCSLEKKEELLADYKLNDQLKFALNFYFSNDVLSSQEDFVLYGPQTKEIEESTNYKLVKQYIKK